MGYDVSVLFAMKHGGSKFPSNTSFYQKLANDGEASSSGRMRWAYYGMPFFLNSLFNNGRRPRLVNSEFEVLIKALSRKIQTKSTTYNLPYVFRVSQAFSAVTGRPISIRTPTNLDKLDLFHATMPLPIFNKKCKKVVTLHDLIPFKLPSSTNINLKHHYRILKASLRDADLIFSVSEQTKKDAVEILGIKDEKIHVTYQMAEIPPEIKNASQDEVMPILNHYDLEVGKYFMFYGAIEPKKKCITAFAGIR